MLDIVCGWDDTEIFAGRHFREEPGFCALEACAQLCALHVRKRTEFTCHAFLLSISSAAPLPPPILSGKACLEARLKGISQKAFSYKAAIRFKEHPCIQVVLTIGTSDYGKIFKQEHLEHYYRELFASLISETESTDTCTF